MRLWRRVFDDYKRIALPLVVLLVANVAASILAVVPLRSSMAAARSQVLDTTLELAQARKLDKQAHDARASRDRAEAELQKFYTTVLPRDQNGAINTIQSLAEAARGAGLIFRTSHYDVTDVRDSRLDRLFATVTLQGRYANFRRFLYELEGAEEFVILERVELDQSSDRAGAEGLLEVSLGVSTYFLKP
jgi:Tfp pilus assembly protein PilO